MGLNKTLIDFIPLFLTYNLFIVDDRFFILDFDFCHFSRVKKYFVDFSPNSNHKAQDLSIIPSVM